jgi:hypothetical protein
VTELAQLSHSTSFDPGNSCRQTRLTARSGPHLPCGFVQHLGHMVRGIGLGHKGSPAWHIRFIKFDHNRSAVPRVSQGGWCSFDCLPSIIRAHRHNIWRNEIRFNTTGCSLIQVCREIANRSTEKFFGACLLHPFARQYRISSALAGPLASANSMAGGRELCALQVVSSLETRVSSAKQTAPATIPRTYKN